MSLRTLLFPLALLTSASLSIPSAHADGATKFVLDPSKSSLTYQVVHPLHETEGKTNSIEGAAVIKAEGGALVQIKADLRTFDSGNSNRDDHMKECTEANKYPYVTLKGLLKDFKAPTIYPADATVTLEGELELHGIKNPISMPVTLHFDSATSAHATGKFDVSLDAYKIERPSLMLTRIDDACHMTVDVAFAAK